ncbi:MAG: hypothetical protein RI897_2141 [Verrucomicrobiota bacterium]
MPRLITLGLLLLTTAPCISAESTNAPVISLSSLLSEMSNPASLARFPSPPYQQLQASSYNRKSVSRDQPEQDASGWFADSDGVSWIREEQHDGRNEYVIMEHAGPGCLTRIWTPYFYYDFNNRTGPRIRIYLDNSPTPAINENFIELLTRNAWPETYGPSPKSQNSLQPPPPFANFTARAGNLYLPIPFAQSCKITLDNKAFYNIVNYRAYPRETRVNSWTPEDYQLAQQQLAQTASHLLQPPKPTPTNPPLTQHGLIAPHHHLQLPLPPGPAAIQNLVIQLDPEQIRSQPELLRQTILTANFDNETTIWTPLGDFFGSPNTLNPFHTQTRTVTAQGTLTCRWIMPYANQATITLQNLSTSPVNATITAHPMPWTWDNRSMHLHANWRNDHIQPGNQFVDWNFIDVHGQGVLVGDQWTVLNLTQGWWGEGDEKIYVDEAYDQRKFPDHFGTGTEDYYGWAGGVNPTRQDQFNHPYLANILVGSTPHNSTLGFNVCTRHRALDAIPFNSRLRFDMEASPGVDQRNPWNLLGYSAVTYYYARPQSQNNRPPNPQAATNPIMSLKQLQQQSAQLQSTN